MELVAFLLAEAESREAAVRFLASPKQERWVYESALRALEFLGE